MPSIAFYTLGCKLNFSETSTIGRQAREQGFEVVDFKDAADIYVINTCSVTENADKKCKRTVKEAKKANPESSVVVIGCYAQLKPQEIIDIDGVDMVLGAAEKFNLMQHLEKIKEERNIVLNRNIKETREFVPGYSFGDRTRSFLKVQDGCDYFCTFCTIPLARGKSRSNTVEETVKVAQEEAQTAVKEVVLTGVNIGDFGVDTDETFYDLILELDKVEGVDRFRISSIEPNLLENRIIDFVAQSNRFVPHFHVPLQSGSDELLKKMRRKYQRDLYADRVKRIKQTMPHACIGVDVIVGFPGETDEHFEETYNFIRDMDVSYLHVFPYSARANTTARKMDDQVPQHVKNERAQRLRILSNKKKMAFYTEHLGKVRTALMEAENKDGFMYGFTENYVKVRLPFDAQKINEQIQVDLKSIADDGTVVAEEVHALETNPTKTANTLTDLG